MKPDNQEETTKSDSSICVEQLLKLEDVAQMLNISTYAVRDYVQYRKIPYYKINGVVRFKLSEIEQWIEDKAIKPATKDTEGGNA